MALLSGDPSVPVLIRVLVRIPLSCNDPERVSVGSEVSCLFGVARMSLIVKSVPAVSVGGRLKVCRAQLLCVQTQAWGCDMMPVSSVSLSNVTSTASKLKSRCGVSLCGTCDVG